MAEDETAGDSKPSTPKQRPATTIDLPAEDVTPSTAEADAPDPARPADNPGGAPGRAGVAFTPLLAAAIGGGAVAVGALWYFGYVLARDVVSDDMAARLARLEAQPRASAPATDSRMMESIAARIAKLETSMAAGPPASVSGSRVAANEDAVKGIGNAVATLSSKHDELRARLDDVQKSLAELRDSVAHQKSSPDPSELDRIAGRIAPLESAVKNVQQAVSTRDANVADKAVRQALVTTSLRDSVLRGAPYGAELAAFKSMGGDAGAVAALEPFAQQGIPTAAVLCGELEKLLPKLEAQGETAPKPAGFLDRLKAGAERLVRIRPVGEIAGTDTNSILARLETKVARADVDGALAELLQLPPQQRAVADSWIAKARARQAAVSAAREISVKSVGALAP